MPTNTCMQLRPFMVTDRYLPCSRAYAQQRMLAGRTVAHMRNVRVAAGPRCGLKSSQRCGKRRGRLIPAPRLAQGLAQAPARKGGRQGIPCRFRHVRNCLHLPGRRA